MTETSEEKTIKVVDYLNAAELRKDISYSNADLDSAMMQQASLFVHYSELHAKASRQLDVVELYLESLEASVYEAIRSKFSVLGEKPTEVMLEKKVAQDVRVKSAKRALMDARAVERNTKLAVEGFRHRRDMLVTHGMIHREQMKGDVMIQQKSASEVMRDRQRAEIRERLEQAARERN